MTEPAESVFQVIRRKVASKQNALIGDQTVSYEELISDAEVLASHLRDTRRDGTRGILCCLPHGREFVTTLLAARFAGMVYISVSPRSPQAERDRFISESASGHIMLSDTAPPPDGYVALSKPFPSHTLWYSDRPGHAFERGDAVVIYSSGSTGRPKGVILADSALSANVRAVANYLSLSSHDRIVTFTPPNFAYALSQILTHLYVGGAVCPWKQGVFNPHGLWQQLSAQGATGLQANPSIFSALLGASEEVTTLDHVRYVMSGGQPLSSQLARALSAACPNARIINMYGCTENGPRVSYHVLPKEISDDISVWPVGKAVEGTEICVFRANGGAAGVGEIGEIGIRGSSLFRAYLGAPEMKQGRMAGDWFMTRDMGHIDDAGDLVLTGRADNIILMGHEKVSPEEIESLLAGVEGIEDAAVGSAADPALFQIPVALIVASAPIEDLKSRALQCLINELGRAKAPRAFFLVNEIPRTLYGKIDRVAVKKIIADMASAASWEDRRAKD